LGRRALISFACGTVGFSESGAFVQGRADFCDGIFSRIGKGGFIGLEIVPGSEFASCALHEWMIGRELTGENDRGYGLRHLAAARVNVSHDAPGQAVIGFNASEGFGLMIGHFGKAELDHFADISLVNSWIVAIGCDSVCVGGDGCGRIRSLLDCLDCARGCVIRGGCEYRATDEQAASNCYCH
jgi:hypothetical protein